jgi:hypothetical protein
MQTENKKKKTECFTYKGLPMIRHENIIYYGNLHDPYIIVLQILETKKVKDLDVASKISVQLKSTDQTLKVKDRIVKQSEKNSFWQAMDLGAIWLQRALED